jgi:hypothetical protein
LVCGAPLVDARSASFSRPPAPWEEVQNRK